MSDTSISGSGPKKRTIHNVPTIKALKGVRPIVCITAYDEPMARFADAAGVDVVLVGDSVGMVSLGLPDTLGVTIEMMEHHTKAVRKGVKNALLVADMPFGSYGSSTAQAVDSAVRLMRAGAGAVKLEGVFEEAIEAITKIGIPVMGHLGMTPQSIHNFGGFKVQAKSEEAADTLTQQAMALEFNGCFAIVLELIPKNVAAIVTKSVQIPTIGIGAGIECDGQIQVIYDLLGFESKVRKHSKNFGNIGDSIVDSISTYCQETRQGKFPTDEHSF